ncbi:MAG: metal-binding protein [Methanocella sp. PtaU1.Bin125]|nr:MAG: metal-binding protein [Methanocella sp. PtaU1.Bin125]
MELSELVRTLEEIAPPELAEETDEGRIGLIVPGTRDVKKIAIALDPTPAVIRKAADAGANALIVHHTLIWNPLTSIDYGLARSLKTLLDHRMSLYAMHTNYDRAPGGVNDTLAALLGLTSVVSIDLACAGLIEKQSLATFAAAAAKALRTDVGVVGDMDKKICTVVTSAGSGFREALPVAKRLNADVLLSSELKHDVIRDRGDVALISAPHYFTEAPAMKKLADRLNDALPAEFIDDPPAIRVIRA